MRCSPHRKFIGRQHPSKLRPADAESPLGYWGALSAGQSLPHRQTRHPDFGYKNCHEPSAGAGAMRRLYPVYAWRQSGTGYDTAGSVKIMRNQNDTSIAAIASKQAAQIFGMEILAEKIEDNQANFTRFLIVAPEPVHPKIASQDIHCLHAKK